MNNSLLLYSDSGYIKDVAMIKDYSTPMAWSIYENDETNQICDCMTYMNIWMPRSAI